MMASHKSLLANKQCLTLLLVVIFFASSVALTPEMFKQFLEHQEHLASSRSRLRTANTTNSTVRPISAKCNASINNLSEMLESKGKKAAAFRNYYVDTFGKPGAGILVGGTTWLGSYGECTSAGMEGFHYCLANIGPITNSSKPPNPFTGTFRWGVCVPKDCSEVDLENGLMNIITVLKLQKKIHLVPDGMSISGQTSLNSVHCAKPSEYTGSVIASLVLCGVVLFLCLVGTIIEVTMDCMGPERITKTKSTDPSSVSKGPTAEEADSFHNSGVNQDTEKFFAQSGSSVPILVYQNKKYVIVEFFLCFSLIRNTSRIMDTNIPPGAITSINGMRVLSMFWVILGHTILWQLMGGITSNIVLEFSILQRYSFQVILNATVSVDSFFFLSGLLVAYLSFRHMEKKNGKLNLFQFYFHRFWRLTPAYMFLLLFYDKLMGFVGEGPLWYSQQVNPICDKYWWTNLLYINNFYPTAFSQSCMGWTWYLANDMQFYIISPIIIYATYRFGRGGFLLSAGIPLVASFIATGVITKHYNFNSGILGGGENPQPAPNAPDFSSYVYVKPYCRISPYLVGMGLGYLLHRIRESTRRPRMWFLLCGWCVAILLAYGPVFGTYSEYRKDDPQPFNSLQSVFYSTFVRCTWALALAWVVYACQVGGGGLVDKILSARFWIPLSRLTYMAYLVHPMVLFAYFSSYQTILFYSDKNIAWNFMATTTISYFTAFIVSVTLEVPMMQLEKIIFKTDRKKD